MTLSSKLYAGAAATQMLTPQTLTATTLSSHIDLQDASDCMIEATIGVQGDTLSGSLYWELELQDSPDDSTYTAVVDANISNPVSGRTATGTFAAITASAGCSKVYQVAYRGNQRYVKVNLRATGSHSTGTIIGVTGFGWVNRAQPANVG
jgi:hypothetical protein